MPSVVIIHATEDTLPARALAEKLRQANLEVILERPPGEDLRSAIKGAAVTLALWSPRSVQQPALAEETGFARGKTRLINACMQNASVPQQFAGDTVINLTGWRGEDEFPAWRELANTVVQSAGLPPLPPPAPRPPSGFFQPGRVTETAGAGAPAAAPAPAQPQQRAAAPPPPPRPVPRPVPPPPPRPEPAPRPAATVEEAASKSSAGKSMMVGVIAVVVLVLAAAGGGAWLFLRGGGQETVAFEEVDINSAEALRAFIASADSDAERTQAQNALVQLEQQSLDAAKEANTIEQFEEFLANFPESAERIYVQGQIQQLRLLEAGAPVAATTTEPEASTTEPAQSTAPQQPAAAPTELAPPATTPAPGSGGGPAPILPPEPAPTEPPATGPTN